MTPSQAVSSDSGLGSFDVSVAVDTDDSKLFLSELFNERPLVRVPYGTRASPVSPKSEQDDFATIIGEL